MRSNVEGGLYRDLEGVLDKPTLANVVLDSFGVGEFGELAQACLDECETLAYQVCVGQPGTPGVRRYSSRYGFKSQYSFLARTSKRTRADGSGSMTSTESRSTR